MSFFSSSRMGFSAEPPVSKSSNAVGEQGVSLPVLKKRLHQADHFPGRMQHRPDQQTRDTRLSPSLPVHLRLNVLRPSLLKFLADWG